MSYFWLFVINQLVSASLLALVALAYGRITKNAVLMHLLWAAVFAKLLLPSPLVIPLPILGEEASYQVNLTDRVHEDLPALIPSKPESIKSAAQLSNNQSTQSHSLSISRLNYGVLLLALWATGTTILFARGLWRYYLLHSLLRNESTADKDANELASSIVDAAYPVSTKRVRLPVVRLFAARISPMLFGMGKRSTIVCPTNLWNVLSEDDRKAFLGHELSHFFRRDHWVRWLEWLATVIYWWFPLVYFARKRLERFEEIACDSWTVTHFPIVRRQYANALLNVVDFLNESNVGVPRLASRMQATQNLEERLRRLLIKESPAATDRGKSLLLVGSIILACPTFLATHRASVVGRVIPNLPITVQELSETPSAVEPDLTSAQNALMLPETPNGWWNAMPVRRWAEFKLKRNDLQLLADAGKGIRIVHPNHSYHQFESGYIRSLSYISSNGRFVIGNNDGEIHVWDVDVNRSVSLVGKSNSPVTSMSFHPDHGLASSDLNGDIRIWDIGSGQIIASTHMKRGIGALRWANNGLLYVLEGDWTSNVGNCDLVTFSANLDFELSRDSLPNSVAVVQIDERYGPLALDWTGRIWSVVTKDALGFINKEQVSGATLCENIFVVLIDKLFTEAAER